MQPKQIALLAAAFVVGLLAAGSAMLLYLTAGGEVPGPVAGRPGAASGPGADSGSPPGAPPPSLLGTPAPDWQVAPIFRLEEDAIGFLGPVALAFLERPGEEPKSPLYLVTELRGTIKVVRRDRSVDVFAELPDPFRAETILPRASASYGLHGICFSPGDRHLYTTAVYTEGGRAYNRITQWESAGEWPWERGRMVRELRKPFAGVPVDRGHSIGNCFVGSDGKLWVGIGDGGQASKTHDVDVPAGKLLRLELDLSAPRDNPFYDPANPDGIRSYVWTTGLRNPWALAEAQVSQRPPEVYIADNGPAVDRLVVGERGLDHPWDGSDTSLTYGALLVWPQAIGPAAMTYLDRPELFPFLERTLVLTAAGMSGVLLIPLAENGTVAGNPAVLMKRPEPRYEAESVVGVSLGPDGLYIAHMVYDAEAFFRESAILKVVPGNPEGGTMPRTPRDLLVDWGCLGCHALEGQGGRISPSFDGLATRLAARLEDPAYHAQLRALDAHPDLEIASLAGDRRQLLAGEINERVKRWIVLKVNHPTFDDPSAEMAYTPVPEPDLQAMARFLATSTR